MSRDGVRAGLAVLLIGVLGVWLVKPIGDPCPDVGRLPAGSQGSSAPSFAPPLTRTCTYTTADGTKAHKRYVPIVDWLIVAVVAGVAGAGVGLAGPGTPAPRARAARRARRTSAAPRAARRAHPARGPPRRRQRRRPPRNARTRASASARSAPGAASAAEHGGGGAGAQRAQGTSTESSCGASRATTYSAASVSDGFSSRCVSRGGT